MDCTKNKCQGIMSHDLVSLMLPPHRLSLVQPLMPVGILPTCVVCFVPARLGQPGRQKATKSEFLIFGAPALEGNPHLKSSPTQEDLILTHQL